MKRYRNNALVSESRPVLDGFVPLQERDGNNVVTNEYAWGLNMGGGIGGLLDLQQGGQNYAYLYDGKGNVTALLNGGQAAVAAYTYDAFGNLMSETGTLSQPFQFSTKSYDEETGLSYFGYRFYSPVIRRWMTRDPIRYAGGMNLYAYANNNSIILVDPLGLYVPGERWVLENPNKTTLIVGGASLTALGGGVAVGAASAMSTTAAAGIGTSIGTASLTEGLVAGGVGIGAVATGLTDPSVLASDVLTQAIPTIGGTPWSWWGDWAYGIYDDTADYFGDILLDYTLGSADPSALPGCEDFGD